MITRLTPDNFEFFTLVTNPERTFVSSSTGLTGVVNVFPRRSDFEKEVQPLSLFSESFYRDQNLDELRLNIVQSTASNISANIEAYMSQVNTQQPSVRKQQTQEVIRFTPSFRFSSNTLRKNVVKETLMPYYRTIYPRAQFTYANYHCLNFFTSSQNPTGSAILYPNSASITTFTSQSVYELSGAFTFDFWMKPRYVQDAPELDYKPGTLMQLTGAYAISLHTGSRKDINGFPSGFRVALALSESANIPPSQLTTASPDTYWTEDNALDRNRWHHVTFRWGGPSYNFGSGSVVVDGKTSSTFVRNDDLLVGRRDPGPGDPSVLVIGNFYEGGNTSLDAMDRFFAADTVTREGLLQLNGTAGVFGPTNFEFTHPLNAEVHDIKFYDKYLTLDTIGQLSESGPQSLDNLKFYLPPFYTTESPTKQFLNGLGGILVTPFFTRNGATETPFAAQMAFGAGGHYVNLDNYLRDFATGLFPRVWELSGSTFEPPPTTILSANDFLYGTGSVRQRLFTVWPCDNGRFAPNFDLLAPLSGTSYVDDLGNRELGVVTLNNIITESLVTKGLVTSGTLLDDLLGAQPDQNLQALPGESLAVLHRTRDPSSNQVVFFDISNIYYGNRIKPGTFKLVDTAVTYSGGKVGVTLRDDENGNLYRADVSGSHATWASVGNIFYDEGIVLVKHPQLFFLGQREYEVSFQGEQNLHVLTINAFARAVRETSSSNPSYMPFDSTGSLANVTDPRAVWITGINIHDDNLNVIARTNFAQPILKRSGDKFLFKFKLDF